MTKPHLGRETSFCNGRFECPVYQGTVRPFRQNDAKAELVEKGLPVGKVIADVEHTRDADGWCLFVQEGRGESRLLYFFTLRKKIGKRISSGTLSLDIILFTPAAVEERLLAAEDHPAYVATVRTFGALERRYGIFALA